jgi:hypothetical protein
METTEEKPVLKYDTIVVSQRGMAEVHGKKIILFVPAAEIDRVRLKFGRSEHNPIVSVSIGILLALVGVFGLIVFFTGKKGNRYDLGLVALGIIGGSLIFDALKQRYFLEVIRKNDVCRLVLSKDAKKNDVDELCNKIKTIYKYQITDDAPLSI